MAKKTTGTKQEVWDGTAQRTPGKLTKADLMLNAAGKVVSKKQHANGQKQAANLQAANAAPRARRAPTPGLHPSHVKGHAAGQYVLEQHGQGMLGGLLGNLLGPMLGKIPVVGGLLSAVAPAVGGLLPI